MTQAKSKDRIELDLFLELMAEQGVLEVPNLSSIRREGVLKDRAPRAHQALLMARETLDRFLRNVNELLPRMAAACLEMLEVMDESGEDVKVVGEDMYRDALAYRLGYFSLGRRAGMSMGFAFAYGGVAGGGVASGVGGCGGGAGTADGSGATTATGHGGVAGGGATAAGSCSPSTGAQGGSGGRPWSADPGPISVDLIQELLSKPSDV